MSPALFHVMRGIQGLMLGIAALGVVWLFILAAFVWPWQDRKRGRS